MVMVPPTRMRNSMSIDQMAANPAADMAVAEVLLAVLFRAAAAIAQA